MSVPSNGFESTCAGKIAACFQSLSSFSSAFVTEELMLIKFQTGSWQVLVRCWSIPVFGTDWENLEENIFIGLWFILKDALRT